MDVDGVLNTGHFIYTEEGKFGKIFGPHDKDGLDLAKSLGLTIDFVTADATGFPITKARIVSDWKFNENNLHLVKDGLRLHWLLGTGYNLNEVAYIGDGIHDVPIIKGVALGIAPCSAFLKAKEAAKYVTKHPAGSGAVLDAVLHIEKVMKKRKFWIF